MTLQEQTRPRIRDSRTFIYRIDADDRLVRVNPDWLDFAVENAAPYLTEDGVLGRPLWDFISDPETAHLYTLMVNRVRETGRPLTVPFRCDSPTMRRQGEMIIAPLPEGEVEFSCRWDWLEERDAISLLDATQPRSDRLLTLCSWCKHAEPEKGEWCEVEEAVRRLDLFADARLPRLTHGICPTCSGQMLGLSGTGS